MPPFLQLLRAFCRTSIRSYSSAKTASVYTDGGHLPNHKSEGPRIGIGCFFGPMSPHNISRRLKTSRPTSPSAEFHAPAVGLEILQETHPHAETYRVYTDCEVVVRLNHVPRNKTWLSKQGLGEVGTGFKKIAERVERREGTPTFSTAPTPTPGPTPVPDPGCCRQLKLFVHMHLRKSPIASH